VKSAAGQLAAKYGLIHMGCAAHQVQLIVQKFLAQPQLAAALETFSSIIQSFKATKSLRKSLNDCTHKRIIAPNSTRWNSTHAAYVRLHELRPVLDELMHEGSRAFNVSASAWQLLTEVNSVLKFFAEITDRMQSDNNSICRTHRAYLAINAKIASFGTSNQFVSQLLQTYPWQPWLQPTINKWNEEASTAEPIKAVRFLDLGSYSRTNQRRPRLIQTTMDWIIRTGTAVLSKTEEFSHFAPAFISVQLHSQVNQFNNGATGFVLTTEEAIALVEDKFDVFDYWADRTRDDKTKILASFACILLGIIASEAAVERSFSHEGLIHSDLRNRLSIQSVINELMVRWNHQSQENYRRLRYKTDCEGEELHAHMKMQ
jgi:hypothetical protein